MKANAAKTTILERVRSALGRTGRQYSPATFERLLASAPKAHPRLSEITHPVELFITQSRAVGAQVTELDSAAEVPYWLSQLPFSSQRLALSEQPEVSGLDWSRFTVDSDYASHGQMGVVKASMAAAETGTVLMHSHDVPTGLLYLVDRLVILLDRAQIKARYEDMWSARSDAPSRDTPRATHLITGPSRTADVEQTIQVGAHGPREVLVVLLP